MKSMQRAIAMTGMTLIAGSALGMSATAASAAPAQESGKTVQAAEDSRDGRWDDRDGRWRDRDRTRTVGRFDSRRSCEWAGWIGERRGIWDDAECYRVGRHTWILRVEMNWRRGGR